MPAGLPQFTPKKTSVPSTMISAWRIAIARRPSSCPPTIVHVEVGVESIRRAIPSLRVSITHAAPL